MRVALVSRELYPLHGGGIGQFVADAARLLSRIAEVTVFTTSLLEPEYLRLTHEGDERLPPAGVRIVFVEEPTAVEAGPWSHLMHAYGARVLDSLHAHYGARGPDLIEFPDFLGEAFVPLQAARTLDPFFDETLICVRVHTSAEMCEVLDGCVKADRWSRALHAMERYGLAHADRLIWQGGDILETYRRFYGPQALAEAECIRYPYGEPRIAATEDAAYEPGAPVRLLYVGRLERRKGVHRLIQAITGLERDDFHLTLVGGDTDTAPLGQSMRAQLELGVADDPRVTLVEAVARTTLIDMIRAHDVVLIPSLWECWPYTALEALHLNRPVLATPVGGLAEMIDDGAGWLAASCRLEDLEDALNDACDRVGELRSLVRDGRPRARAATLASDEEILDAYGRLAELPRARFAPVPAPDLPPLVSAIVPYFRASAHAADTIASLRAQSYPRLEIVLVLDGSFDPADWLVAELSRGTVRVVTQINQGLGAARNFGISQSSGRYVFPLDADNCVEPSFVERCVRVLERRPDVAYVTAWSRYILPDGRLRPGPDLGFEPIGNQAALNDTQNVAGDAAAVVRRRVFDAGFAYDAELTSYEDWHLYRELGRAGQLGEVIPERLLHYRVRPDSMQAQVAIPNRERLLGEIEARLRENGMRWESSRG